MPWKEVSTMSQRQEFIVATQPGRNVRALCRAFSISPKTGYKWLARYAAEGEPGLQARSRRPQQMPQRTAASLEQAILHLRTAQPTWGGRKLHARLQTLGYAAVPAPSTITAILRRHGCLAPAPAAPAAWQRFAHATPNALWHMEYEDALADFFREVPVGGSKKTSEACRGSRSTSPKTWNVPAEQEILPRLGAPLSHQQSLPGLPGRPPPDVPRWTLAGVFLSSTCGGSRFTPPRFIRHNVLPMSPNTCYLCLRSIQRERVGVRGMNESHAYGRNTQ